MVSDPILFSNLQSTVFGKDRFRGDPKDRGWKVKMAVSSHKIILPLDVQIIQPYENGKRKDVHASLSYAWPFRSKTRDRKSCYPPCCPVPFLLVVIILKYLMSHPARLISYKASGRGRGITFSGSV